MSLKQVGTSGLGVEGGEKKKKEKRGIVVGGLGEPPKQHQMR